MMENQMQAEISKFNLLDNDSDKEASLIVEFQRYTT